MAAGVSLAAGRARRRPGRAAVLAGAVMLVAAGCGHRSGAAASPGASRSPAAPSLTVTAAANGDRVQVTAGEVVHVLLTGGGRHWSVPVASPASVLARRAEQRRAGGGVLATFLAVRAGQALLRADGTCAGASPGQMSCTNVLAWSVRVQVS